MSFATIQTISFDATGTLFDPFPSIGAIYADILQEHGIIMTEAELEMRFLAEFHKSRVQTITHLDEQTEIKRWQQIVSGILGDQFTDGIFKSLWHEMACAHNWKLKPRVFKTLSQLKEQGYRLIMVSNWDRRLYGILETLKLSPYFERIFISTEIGVEKPAEAIYVKAAEALDLAPETLLHLGNSPANDFKPALRSGWNALLLHNRIPHGFEPGTVLGSIDQLPEVLKSEKVTLQSGR